MEQIKKPIGKKRDTNFELLRIVAMIMIITLHFNGHGGVLDKVPFLSKPYFFSNILEYGCIIAVNLYVMITGYYMIKSKIKIKKVVALELQIIFYTLGIYIILLATGIIKYDTKSLLKTIFPITTNHYWFMTAYMGLYILIPFINKLANNLNKKQYLTLIIISTILLSVVRTINPANAIFEAKNGYSLIWLIYIYLLAGYIRLYYDKNTSKTKLILIYIATITIQIALKIMNTNLNLKKYSDFALAYNSIFILIESIAVFLLFRKIHIKNEIINKIILFISPLVLGVYLIQEHNNLRTIYWNQIFTPSAYIGGIRLVIAWIIETIIIFTLSCVIEKIRQIIFKQISKTKIVTKISDKLSNIQILNI